MHDAQKRAAAEAAVDEVTDGMLVGLGTGTTAAFAIAAIARRVAAGLSIRAVATSRATDEAARRAGIEMLDFATISDIDLTIDGADEIDARLWAIKGGGGAMVREKVVAAASRRMVVIADASKLVERIGVAKLPVEVLPFAAAFVAARVVAMGATVTWRRADDGDYRSDQGNPILDARFAAMPDPPALAGALDALPGVVGHGLFLDEVDALYLAGDDAVTRLERPSANR